MYIMCVCLFSALSRRVGALQISIIIIQCNTDTFVSVYNRTYNGIIGTSFLLVLSFLCFLQCHWDFRKGMCTYGVFLQCALEFC